MISIFTLPKPFSGIYDHIQKNAIESWKQLNPNAEIILFGDETGTEQAAKEFGFRHVSALERNQYGTPLVNFIFNQAQKLARYDIVCYINTDIILTEGFETLLARVSFSHFLIIGQRWNLDVTERINFKNHDWQSDLKKRVQETGELCDETGIDYFLFKKGLFNQMPRFAIGRTKYDNWLIYQARLSHAEVIDATKSFFIVHQNHGYPNHILAKNRLSQDIWVGPEVEENLRLAGDMDHCFSLSDAQWILRNEQLQRKRLSLLRLLRNLDVEIILRENGSWLSPFIKPLLWFRLCLRQLIRKVLQQILMVQRER
ncbi:MAG: hypothetical protein COV74_03235 [Candidatus Omnitrophica bacterium CG11_big_fil_rev_8_21_14_0_20_45_26]|uniref:Glycosyltransferase 2-like domain-containing protein n=1 Tax=Candidatus Abzuiibacterium crystallinum TaxID=1974748 RepID=A0A2H0LR51_9BACT|nr:MAG: hypothetical protein COV74_03235 [Candidatus Omnitrophica bacterium CG11_big_fil_rev_8_21_14_0_20_45_26]PIW64688.1 MAG: hypothetical protein COW12_05260 [Candidatus Omnitrophica bacterium CG12_big_fil_rev_8_21_14_0_65_45_16]